MPFKNDMKLILFTLVILACSSSGSLEIDYNDPDTSIEYAAQYAEAMVAEKKYNEAEEAYNWINSKNPAVFRTTYHLKLIDLYGNQGRYEKQLEEYKKIFVSDSIDNTEYVPHFYQSIGMSLYDRAKIPLISGEADSTLLRLAIDNFVKCFAYTLYKDAEIQSQSRYFAGLSYSKMGDFDKSLEMFEFIVDSMRGTSIHPKAFFKEKDYQDFNDIEVTQEMMRQYDEAYQFVKSQTDIKELREKSDELSRQPAISDTTAIKPDIDELPKPIETDSLKIEDHSDELPEPVSTESDSIKVTDDN